MAMCPWRGGWRDGVNDFGQPHGSGGTHVVFFLDIPKVSPASSPQSTGLRPLRTY